MPAGAASGAETAAQPGEHQREHVSDNGIRRVRTMSNWTAAALLVRTGAATVALATHASPGATSTAPASSATSTGTPGATAPHVGGPVVTSGGSGATGTSTTRVVNGKTVVTRGARPAAHHDG